MICNRCGLNHEDLTPAQKIAHDNWDREQLQKKLELEEKKKQVKLKLISIMHERFDFDTLIDSAQSIVIEGGVRLQNKDFVDIADAYFNFNKHPKGLIEANQIYRELDHANNMVI